MGNRVKVINSLLSTRKKSNYLEIGVFNGQNLEQINAEIKWGVDPNPRFHNNPIVHFFKKRKYISQNSDIELFELESDKFFSNNKELLKSKGISVAFVDGLHTYEQALRDIDNCLDYLDDDGVIVAHDCSPPSEASSRRANSWSDAAQKNKHIGDWDGAWCGDVWKAILTLRVQRDDLMVCVLDCDFGLGIIKKGRPDSKVNQSLDSIDLLEYKDLEANRSEWLNLKPPSYVDAL